MACVRHQPPVNPSRSVTPFSSGIMMPMGWKPLSATRLSCAAPHFQPVIRLIREICPRRLELPRFHSRLVRLPARGTWGWGITPCGPLSYRVGIRPGASAVVSSDRAFVSACAGSWRGVPRVGAFVSPRLPACLGISGMCDNLRAQLGSEC